MIKGKIKEMINILDSYRTSMNFYNVSVLQKILLKIINRHADILLICHRIIN